MTMAWSSGRSATSYFCGMHRFSMSFVHCLFSCESSLKSADRAWIMVSSSSLQPVEKLASSRCCSRHSLARALPGGTSAQNCIQAQWVNPSWQALFGTSIARWHVSTELHTGAMDQPKLTSTLWHEHCQVARQHRTAYKRNGSAQVDRPCF